jgi:hypothetical protein
VNIGCFFFLFVAGRSEHRHRSEQGWGAQMPSYAPRGQGAAADAGQPPPVPASWTVGGEE